MCNHFDLRPLREKCNLSLSELSELSRCNIISIDQAERGKKISATLREKILSVLLQIQEEGLTSEVKIWRTRALQAEEKLALIKEAMTGWIKKI